MATTVTAASVAALSGTLMLANCPMTFSGDLRDANGNPVTIQVTTTSEPTPTPSPTPTPTPTPTPPPTDGAVIVTESQGASTLASGVLRSATNSAFRYTTIPTTAFPAGWLAFQVPSQSPSQIDPAALLEVQFLTNSPVVEIRLMGYNSNLNIRVDGALVRPNAFKLDASGQQRNIRLDFSNFLNPSRDKLISIVGNNMPFGGVFTVGSSSIVYPTQVDEKPLMVFFGDSYTFGNGADGPDRIYGRTIADRLGFNFWADGIGGAGWLSTGAGAPVTRVSARIAKLNRTPSVIVNALGYNDAGGDMAAVLTNCKAGVAAQRTAWPNAKIVLLGPWTPLGAKPTLVAVKNAIEACAVATSATFVDIENIINSSNSATYTGPDGVHPAPANDGHAFLGAAIATRFTMAGISR